MIYDVVIVGSGIGGLCCGSLLSLAGKKVLICEAHYKPGGVAHGFKKNGYKFESGPSLWSGLSKPQTTNPLSQILNLLEEDVELIKYKEWGVIFPEAKFTLDVGNEPFRERVKILRGTNSLKEWDNFLESLKPLCHIIESIPLLKASPTQLNFSEILSLIFKCITKLNSVQSITTDFGTIAEKHLKDPFLKNWVDLLCFLISGMSMHDTNSAAMITLFKDWFEPNSYLEYPKGGSESIVNALIRGLKKNGGDLLLSSRVKEISINNDLVEGVLLENGSKIIAPQVVMNCDIWTSKKIIPKQLLKKWPSNNFKRNKCGSFLHIHLGFDASGLKELPIHTIHVANWEKGVTSERNISVYSIPSVLDPSMAPQGKHVLHGYTPASEPWEIWNNIKHNEKEYQVLKEKRCSIFIDCIKEFIPDIEDRIELKMLGTPITHKQFTNTYCGSYGPAISINDSLFPGCKTPIKNLLSCGASTFPGIGIPAVAASGAYAACEIIGKRKYIKLLKKINL